MSQVGTGFGLGTRAQRLELVRAGERAVGWSERACSSSPTQRPTKRELIESDGKQLRHAVVFQAAADMLLRFHGLLTPADWHAIYRWYFRCGGAGRDGAGWGGGWRVAGVLRANLVREEGRRHFFRKHAVRQRVLEPTLHLPPPEVKQSKAPLWRRLRPNGDRTVMASVPSCSASCRPCDCESVPARRHGRRPFQPARRRWGSRLSASARRGFVRVPATYV